MSTVPPEGRSRPESRLRRLDDALVPRLQRGARPVGSVLGLPGRMLRRLDDRFAGGRPARAVRRHRGVVAFVVVAVAFAATAVHFQRYPVLQERARQAAENQGVPGGDDGGVPGGGNDDAPAASVGPLVGAQVEPYLASRDDALEAATADEERVAVVSFASFLEPAEAEDVADDLEVHLVQYRLPERTPRPAEVEVDDGIAASLGERVAELVGELRAEGDEVASTLESGVEDEDFRADYEARLDELRGLRNTLTSDPAIAFAVVVTGPVDALRALADDERVRVVDLAPPDTPVDSTTFHGVLPTDRDRFTFGRQS
jgi:hypothetical protein